MAPVGHRVSLIPTLAPYDSAARIGVRVACAAAIGHLANTFRRTKPRGRRKRGPELELQGAHLEHRCASREHACRSFVCATALPSRGLEAQKLGTH